jgi:hypothetical protein
MINGVFREGLNSSQVEEMLSTLRTVLTRMSSKPLTLGLPMHFQTIPNTVRPNSPIYWTCMPDQLILTDGCCEFLSFLYV